MRCSYCKKKTHITFDCPCSAKTCIGCRLPEDHVCPSLHKTTEGKQKLEKDLQRVVADKMGSNRL